MLGFTISIVDGASTRHTVVTRYHKLLALLLGRGARIKENCLVKQRCGIGNVEIMSRNDESRAVRWAGVPRSKGCWEASRASRNGPISGWQHSLRGSGDLEAPFARRFSRA